MTRTEETLAAHLDDAQCADLVLRLVPPGERELALAHAAACPACEARLRVHVSAADRAATESLLRRDPAVADTGRPQDPLARLPVPSLPLESERFVLSGRAIRTAPAARAARRSWPRVGWWRDARVLTVAAAAGFLVAIAWPLLGRGTLDSRPIWLPSAHETVRTREGESEDPRLAAGLAAYEARDLEAADRELSSARASGSTDLMRRLYLGHVRLERGDARGAVAMLESLEWKTIPEPWRREGVRVYARALRQDGNLARADSIERALRHSEPTTPIVP